MTQSPWTFFFSFQAKEQIRLAEEVKITKEKIKEVEEEWQSNLLNWKSKRRVNNNILEGDKDDNNTGDGDDSGDGKRKIKTFSEILNEKAKSGHRIGYNLHRYGYEDEEDDDISGIIRSSSNNNSNDSKTFFFISVHVSFSGYLYLPWLSRSCIVFANLLHSSWQKSPSLMFLFLHPSS